MDHAQTKNEEPASDAGHGDEKRRRRVAGPDDPEFLVRLETLCNVLSLPLKWARRMAWQGALPCVRIGHRLMFRVEAVRQHLRQQAERHNQFGGNPRGITTSLVDLDE